MASSEQDRTPGQLIIEVSMIDDKKPERLEKNYLHDKMDLENAGKFGFIPIDDTPDPAEIKKNNAEFMEMVKSILRFKNGV